MRARVCLPRAHYPGAAITVLSNRLLFSYLGVVPARVVSSWSSLDARRTRPNEIIVRERESVVRLFALASLLLGGFGAAAATEPTVVA